MTTVLPLILNYILHYSLALPWQKQEILFFHHPCPGHQWLHKPSNTIYVFLKLKSGKKINEGMQKQNYNFLKALLIEKFFLEASHQMVSHNPVLFQAISVSLGHWKVNVCLVTNSKTEVEDVNDSFGLSKCSFPWVFRLVCRCGCAQNPAG